MVMQNGGDNDGFDYLEFTPQERQATAQDGISGLQYALSDLLRDIRHEQLKDHPDVLTTTKVDGNPGLLTQNQPTKVTFQVGGKPVTVHKLVMWQTAAIDVYISVRPFSYLGEGFHLPADASGFSIPLVLDISVDELYVMAVGANYVINAPASAAAKGIYIYGWTIPDYERMNK